jgi:hypothetical protein
VFNLGSVDRSDISVRFRHENWGSPKNKPSIVAIGTFEKTRRPPPNFRGTGFVVADGLHVIINAHVLGEKIDTEKRKPSAFLPARGER